MLALQISSMKNFMSHFLAADTFDLFLLEEAIIRTAGTYTIEGRVNREFFTREEQENGFCPYEFQPWSEIRGLCFQLMKGRRTPLFFKFVLQLKPEEAPSMLKPGADTDLSFIKCLTLNIRYDGSKAVLTTGTSLSPFVLSKEADVLWDRALAAFLDSHGILFEALL